MKYFILTFSKNKVLLFISFLIGVLTYFYIVNSYYPMELVPTDENRIVADYAYDVDLEKDNISEKITLIYLKQADTYAFLAYRHDNSVMLQHNSKIFVDGRWVFFADVNNDNFDELIYFSKDSTRLYLTVFELKSDKPIVDKKLIATKSPKSTHNNFDIWLINLKAVDLNKDGYNDLIFTVSAGFAIYPRSIYTFDIHNKETLKEFKTNAFLQLLEVQDIDGDYNPEIIVSSYASDNIKEKVEYSDNTSWLFVLNSNLELKFPPLNFGGLGSALEFLIPQNTTKGIILNLLNFNKSKNASTTYIIDYKGNIKKQFQTYERKPRYFLGSKNDILSANTDGSLSIYNTNLVKLVEKENILPDEITPSKVLRLYTNKKIYFMLWYPYKFVFLDENYDVVAEYNIKDAVITVLPQATLDEKTTVIRIKYRNYLSEVMVLQDNKIYTFRLLISFLAAISALMFLTFLLTICTLYKCLRLKITNQNNKNIDLLVISNDENLIFSEAKINEKITKNLREYLEVNLKLPSNLKKYIINLTLRALRKKLHLNKNLKSEDVEYKIELIPQYILWQVPYFILIVEYKKTDYTGLWLSSIQKIAHDIKTPLSTISLNIKTIESMLKREKNIEISKYTLELNCVNDEIRRIKTLTQSFLKFLNINKPNFQFVSLAEQVELLKESFSTYLNNGIEVIVDLQNDAERVYADKQQLQEIFKILFENSLDAMKGKGKIEIRSHLIQDITKVGKSFVEIQFSDSGTGIEESEIDSIFEPTYSTKKGGNGLGLSILSKIVNDHNGSIDVFSKPNLGTTFTIRFPNKVDGEQNIISNI